jgi:GNAT superfamily N-acetyltransferase
MVGSAPSLCRTARSADPMRLSPAYAISTSMGRVVAKLDDVFVAADYRGKGVGTRMLESLKAECRKKKIGCIDTAVHKGNPGAAKYYARLGFKALEEERLAVVL